MNVTDQTIPPTSKKQTQLLSTARDLFWKHGFKRVSIEEICATAGVSKMTFYRFFSNKVELARAVLEKEITQGLTKFRKIMADPSSPDEKIHNILIMKMEGTHQISREFLQDFYGDKELGLKEFIEEKTRHTWNEMLDDFRAAQRKGIFREDMKVEFLVYFSQKIAELVTDEKLLRLYPSPQDLVMELTKFVSYGISPRTDESSPKPAFD